MAKDIENQNTQTEENNENQESTESKEDYVPKKSFEGIKNDLIATRQEKQYYANQLNEAQQKMKEFQDRLKELESKKENQELNSVLGEDDDEPVTAAKLKQAWKQLQQAQAREKEQKDYQARLSNFNESIAKMRTDTKEKAKYGLDWDTLYPVIQRIYANKKAANPAWERALIYESNPAQELYEMALKEPDVKEKAKMVENEKVLGNMENRKTDKSAVDSSGSSPKTKKTLTEADIARMTPAEALARKEEINEFLSSRSKKKGK